MARLVAVVMLVALVGCSPLKSGDVATPSNRDISAEVAQDGKSAIFVIEQYFSGEYTIEEAQEYLDILEEDIDNIRNPDSFDEYLVSSYVTAAKFCFTIKILAGDPTVQEEELIEDYEALKDLLGIK
jgi:hypothetical protein